MASMMVTEKIFEGRPEEARVILMDVGILVGVGYGDQINNEIFLTDEMLDKIVELRKLHSAEALTIED